MSVARRAGSGAASACVQYATRRRWAAAARASRSCWAGEATRRRWASAARANRNNAVSSGPIIPRVAKRSIATTYAARTMRWSGVILVLFIVYHLLHMTAGLVSKRQQSEHLAGTTGP